MTNELQYGMSGDRPYGLYYQHSGRVPIPGVVMAGFAGIAVALIGAAAYAYLDLYIPIIYANILGTVAFGALIGFVTGRVAKAGKVRSVPITFALVGVATLIGYCFCWICWVYATFQRFAPESTLTFSELIDSPTTLWTAIRALNESGTWSMSTHDKENVSGLFLTLIWIVEGATIFVTAFKVAHWAVKSEMFCESCSRWCGPTRVLRRTGVGDPHFFRQQFEAHNFACIDTLAPLTANRYWSIEYGHCASCKKLHALSIIDYTVAKDKKGNNKITKKVLIDKLLLEPQEAAALTAAPPAPQPPPLNNTPTAPDAEV